MSWIIEINNLTTSSVDEEWVRQIARAVLRGEKKDNAALSVAFVGQGRMRQLNKKYLKKNRTTDVLAFPEPQLKTDRQKPAPAQNKYIGEIIISTRDVKKNARRYNAPYEQDLAHVIIHGILHLLGYDHEKSEKEAKKMFERQAYYLAQLNPKRK